MTTLVLIAKEPVAGRAKTRLHPPLSLEQAASLAAACIDDTAAVVAAAPVSRRILFFDGDNVPASTADFELVTQPHGDLDERLAAIFDRCEGPTLLIGMDTPQVTLAHIAPALAGSNVGVDAWFGSADDGGFWALGMREPRGDLIRGVAMSRDDTGAAQYARLTDAGLRVGLLESLTDVDTIADARRVAQHAPDTAFAGVLRSFGVTGAAAS